MGSSSHMCGPAIGSSTAQSLEEIGWEKGIFGVSSHVVNIRHVQVPHASFQIRTTVAARRQAMAAQH
jgi:hypothetical protein